VDERLAAAGCAAEWEAKGTGNFQRISTRFESHRDLFCSLHEPAQQRKTITWQPHTNNTSTARWTRETAQPSSSKGTRPRRQGGNGKSFIRMDISASDVQPERSNSLTSSLSIPTLYFVVWWLVALFGEGRIRRLPPRLCTAPV
jgi:hypothetical protein